MIDKDLIKTDFYEAVNKNYLAKLEIPEDKKSIGAFNQIDMKIEKQLLDDFSNLSYDDQYVTEEMVHYLKFYRSIVNNHNKKLTKNHKVYEAIDKIKKIKNKNDLNEVLIYLNEFGFGPLFKVFIHSSFKNSDLNILYLDVADTILPSKEYYMNKEQKEIFLKVFENVMLKIFEKFSIDNAQITLSKAFNLDQKIVEYIKTSEELADYTKMYNKKTLDEIAKYSDFLDFKKHIKHFIKDENGEFSVTQLRFFENINKIFSNNNIDEIKSLILVKFLYKISDLFTEELRLLKAEFSNSILGIKEAKSIEKFAYAKGMQLYSEVVGNYYGHKYFGEDAKKDIYDIVYKIIAMYKKRLAENTWLQNKTKEKAILKLSTIKVMLGYPDKLQEVYKLIKYNENLSLYENFFNNIKIFQEYEFSKFNKAVDHKIWGMPASMVNAYYSPSSNLICFPAAILNKPFYSMEQTISENYGGIGAVIAHEISHAFDNNGANFDENGNMNNWWQESDFKEFKILTEKMINQFDGIEIYGGKVNGTQVVSENLADVGGLACAINCCKLENDYDLAQLFINFARIWAMKARKEYESLLIKSDVHAPSKLRANIQSSNMDEFYQVFDIKPGDKMYIPKKDRIIVW